MSITKQHYQAGVFPVREFGAFGDGKNKDTEAIQKAIDECSASGGGQVLVSSGVYLTGTIYLRDNVDLHLSPGAILLGSPDQDAYNKDDKFPECEPFRKEQVSGSHLIIGYEVKNISISGSGTIDGNSFEFFENLAPYKNDDSYRAPKQFFPFKDWRPGQMIWLCRCDNIIAKDVSLRNATYWTFLMLGCKNVHVRGLSITNPPQTPNGDGIGIDCCQNVTVSDCTIITGDDCITLRANISNLGEDRPCQNVVVSNCVLSSPANCIRVGVGDGHIRDCMFNNLVIADCRVGINMISRFPGPWSCGALMENITFSNINIDAILAIQALHGAEALPGRGLKHITFSNIRAKVTAGAYIGGNAQCDAEDISFRDCDFYVQDEKVFPEFVDRVRFPEPIEGCTGEDGSRILPAPLYAKYIDGLQASNVRVHWDDNLQRTWLKAIWFEQCKNVEGPTKVEK